VNDQFKDLLSMKYLLQGLGFSFVTAGTLLAQDYERFAPKELNNQSAQAKLTASDELPELGDDTRELLPALKGVVMRLKQDEVTLEAPAEGGVQVADSEVMRDADFKEMVAAHLGKPVSMRSLQALTREVILFYRDQGMPVVDVVLPEQDISNGVLQILVIEGRLGNVEVTGNKYFKSERIADEIRLPQGELIHSEPLLDDVNWINQNPFLTVRPVFTRGEKVHTTDLLLQVEDRRPFQIYGGYEDSGNDLTGQNRYLAGFNWGNVFGIGHQFNYQFTTSDDIGDLQAHAASYIIPLPWRHRLNFFGSYVSTDLTSGPFNIEGESIELGMRYRLPLPGFGEFTHGAYTGVDYKRSSNALEFGVLPTADTTTEIMDLVLGYEAGYKDSNGFTSLDLSVVYSPGGLFDHDNDEDYAASREGAESDYVYFELRASRISRLPWGMSLSNSINAQWSETPLLASEQLSAGGYSSVRGYDERELNLTDNGFIARNELRLPQIDAKWGTQIQFLGFIDYALLQAAEGDVMRADGSLEQTVQMCSVGPGVRVAISKNFTLRADYGVQLIDTHSSAGEGRFHIGATLSF